ncbi:hypothetical protein MTO96_033691 [Rhipicephalus appendiculatus]
MSAQSAPQAEIMKKRGPGTRRSPGTRHKRPRDARPTHAALEMPNASYQAGAEAVPRHPYAPGPSEPVVPGPSPAPGANCQTRSVATWTFQAFTEPPTSYFSAVPGKKQERAHRAKDESRLFAPFRGRTITDIDRPSKGSLPPTEPPVHLLGRRDDPPPSDGAGIRRLAAVTGGRSNGSLPGGLNVIAADRLTPVSASGRPICCGIDEQPSDTAGRRRLHPCRPAFRRANLSSPLFCIYMTLSWRCGQR